MIWPLSSLVQEVHWLGITQMQNANSLATASGYRTWQSKDACALSRHCEPLIAGEQAFPHSRWCGHPKSHLDHCGFMRKGLEFAPQQMPGTQSQLGGLVGLVGGRWKIAWVGLWGPQSLSQGHNHYTTYTYTHTRAHTHTHAHIRGGIGLAQLSWSWRQRCSSYQDLLSTNSVTCF